ncbi:MAG: hypothetical protein H0V44_04040 [Planctomycetes bacterium]|nr:hypothetical protein [Planctomycetota bacterium]
MTDTAASASASASPAPASPSAVPAKQAKPGFTFTDPGCRTEVRVGALLILAAVFLWLWLGPQTSSRLYLVGAPLLLIGIPLQAFQAASGRPGYPWKLGLAFAILATLMWPDLRYQETLEGKVHVQPVVPLLLAAGLWILVWWPVAHARARKAPAGAFA